MPPASDAQKASAAKPAQDVSVPAGQAGRAIQNPDFLAQYAATMRFSLGKPNRFTVVPDGSAVVFLRSEPRSFAHALYELDIATGKERLLVDASTLLRGGEESLSADEAAQRERKRIATRGIVSYELSRDGSRVLVPMSGQLFVINRQSGEVKSLAGAAGYALDPELSPDGSKIAMVRDGDLYVTDIATGKERRLTKRDRDTVEHGLAEFVAQEEMQRHRGYFWSPDSKHIAYQRTDTENVEILRLLDPRYPERSTRDARYPRAGTQNADVRLGIAAVTGGNTVWVDWDRQRYPYLATVTWRETAAPLTIVVQNRQQTEAAVLAVNPATGATTTLLTERDDAWLNLDQDMPHWLPDGSGFLWTTERSGAWQVELRSRDGSLRHAVTSPELGYRGLVHVHQDAKAGALYVMASTDPTSTQLVRIPLQATVASPGVPELLTQGRGMHMASFSENHTTYVLWKSTLAGESEITVRRTDTNTAVASLRSLAEEPPLSPNLQITEVRAGAHSFHTAVVRPRSFDPKLRYPVIVNVYGGPHGSMVMALPERYLLAQWIADNGFIVVSIDGRGTPNRGRTWERAIKGDFITVPLTDQADALRALGEAHPELDLSRVGIYGWSFGGYFSAMAVMQRPDVFHVGIAGAPVADWLDYDTHYTERYIGLPSENKEAYTKSSVLTYAERLSRPLLIIHGTVDDNVYFLHSLKLSDALFRAGKDHDFLPLSGFTHMVPDPLVTTRLYSHIVGYFQKHLGGPR